MWTLASNVQKVYSALLKHGLQGVKGTRSEASKRCFDPIKPRLATLIWTWTARGDRQQPFQSNQRALSNNQRTGHRLYRGLGIVAYVLLLELIRPTEGFMLPVSRLRFSHWNSCPGIHSIGKEDASLAVSQQDALSDFQSDFETIGDDPVTIEDLTWRVEKLRLEEQNTKRFLKARPRFLPYEECRRWVHSWGKWWQNDQEWNDWIAMGEKSNPYVPNCPDVYYGRLNQWISWEHFLGTDTKNENNEKDSNFE